MKHPTAWHTAHPLWPLALADAAPTAPRFRAPALLRFAGDDFMPQLADTLATDPLRLADLVARPETWREEGAGWRSEQAPAQTAPLKLYQPAHHRFYLVAAALVCQLPGLPDRRVDAAARETVSFVMRRLVPKPGRTFDPEDEETYDEYGWVGTQQQGVWQPIPDRGQVGAAEERLPLFPSAFTFEGRSRRLLAGLVPAGRRDVYEAGAAATTAPAPAAVLLADDFSSPAVAQASEQVNGGLRQVVELLSASGEAVPLETAKIAFVHALLDLALFLSEQVRPVWDALVAGSPAGLSGAERDLYDHLGRVGLEGRRSYRAILVDLMAPTHRAQVEEGTVTGAFLDARLGPGGASSRGQLRQLAEQLLTGGQTPVNLKLDTLKERLIAALGDPRLRRWRESVAEPLGALGDGASSDAAAQDALLMTLLAMAEFLRVELPALWTALAEGAPAGLTSADRAVYDLLAGQAIGPVSVRELLADTEAHRLDILGGRITPALLVVGRGLSAADIAEAAALAAPLEGVVRTALTARPLPTKAAAQAAVAAAPPEEAQEVPAFYRIRCVYERPQCAGYEPPVVSSPSAPFQLASFYDPDAPIRPIRIQMPDVSLKNLRRMPRGVAIAVSKELREQIARVRNAGLKNLTEGNIGGAPSVDFGLVCSLSIPIITICALILLMIIVQLLNIVFWWLPYFILCLPRIGLRR